MNFETILLFGLLNTAGYGLEHTQYLPAAAIEVRADKLRIYAEASMAQKQDTGDGIASSVRASYRFAKWKRSKCWYAQPGVELRSQFTSAYSKHGGLAIARAGWQNGTLIDVYGVGYVPFADFPRWSAGGGLEFGGSGSGFASRAEITFGPIANDGNSSRRQIRVSTMFGWAWD